MNKLNFVSCVSWVPKGVSKEIPNRLKMSKEEVQMKIEQNEQMMKQLNIECTENENIGEEMQIENENISEEERQIIDRYNLNDYDDDEANDTALNHSEIVVFDDNQQDPYLNNEDAFSDDEDEKNDFRIKPTDNLLLAGHIEEDSISLEVKIYNLQDDIYVHHEIYLPAYPLCFEWFDFNGENQKANFLAIGDMNKDINVWDLDTVDILDPAFTLTGHKDSVLDLSWNTLTRKVIASGSADKTCRLWDLESKKSTQKIDFYKCNVQSVCFHPLESQILLTGDCKGRASIVDCQSGSIKKWKVCQDEIEKVIWNKYNPYTFLCATSTGSVYVIDCRNENSHLFTIKAHNEMISGLELSSSCNGCLVTASSDKLVKVWHITDTEAKFIKQIEPQVGTILSLSANPDLPFTFAVSGDNIAENIKILDLSTYKAVRDNFNYA